jgi:hypothetical protein
MNVKRASLIVLLLATSVFAAPPQEKSKDLPRSESSAFTVNDANAVLAQFRNALEAHSERNLSALFDGERMKGFLPFQDQLRGFLSRNDGIRVNVRSIQASGEGDKGMIAATFEMETTSRAGIALRRQEQLRFDLTHSERGWLIVDINPRDFFE